MKKLSIVEVFPTIQGEGAAAGRPSIFIRLAGCNLWDGLESGRSSGAGKCSVFCDTQFLIRGEPGVLDQNKTYPELKNVEVEPVAFFDWLSRVVMTEQFRYHDIVFTGGEPMLQLQDDETLDELLHFVVRIQGRDQQRHNRAIRAVWIETNGSVVSVKTNTKISNFLGVTGADTMTDRMIRANWTLRFVLSPKPPAMIRIDPYIVSSVKLLDRFVYSDSPEIVAWVAQNDRALKILATMVSPWYVQAVDPTASGGSSEDVDKYLAEALASGLLPNAINVGAVRWQQSVQIHKTLGLP